MSCLALTLINMASNLESDSQNGEEGVTVESRYCASGLQPWLGSCLRKSMDYVLRVTFLDCTILRVQIRNNDATGSPPNR